MKPKIRQSNAKHYFECPQRYQLAVENENFIDTTMAMRDGLIFEYYVLGGKPDHDEAEFKKTVIGKKKAETLEPLKRNAELLKKEFGEGTPYVRFEIEEENFIATGEADFIGMGNYNGQMIKAIWDIKHTSDINKIWNSKVYKQEFLQAVMYTWMYFKEHSEILPFIYKICEQGEHEALFKTIKINVTVNDFIWLENQLNKIADDFVFDANANAHNCLGYKNPNGKCKYIEICPKAKKMYFNTEEKNFSDLLETVEPVYKEYADYTFEDIIE